MNETSMERRHFLALSAAAAVVAGTARGASPSSGPPSAQTVCVLGATGRVGSLIVQQVLAAGFKVVAVSRSAEKLRTIASAHAAGSLPLETLQGDVSADGPAQEFAQHLLAKHGRPHAVVAVLSSSEVDGPMRILDNPSAVLRKAFDTNFFTHVAAARALIPLLNTGASYVGINGGLANFPGAGMAQLTTTQSATRALYEVLALEAQAPQRAADQRPAIRALELFGLVDDGSGAKIRPEMRIEGMAVGRRVAEIITQPQQYPGPILALKAKAFS